MMTSKKSRVLKTQKFKYLEKENKKINHSFIIKGFVVAKCWQM